MTLRIQWLVVAGISLLAARGAHAQAELVPTDAPKPADTKTVIQGWNPFFGLTSTLNMVSNSNVIGQVDGVSTLFGLGLLGGADYIDGKHLLQTTLSADESFSHTPVVDRFVKSNDIVKLEGLYSYFIQEHYGAYGRLSFASSLFPSNDIRGTPTSWVDATGAVPVPLATGATSQRLAGAFAPLTISESAGAFADPVRSDDVTLSVRLGVGGRSTFADGVFVNHDDATTPAVELLRLSDVQQLGVEAFVGALGKLQQGKLNYKAGLAVLLPFVNNDAADRSATSLTRVAFEGNLTYAVSSWLSVVYSAAITRDPQLFPAGKDQVQVQNTLLLTFNLNLVKKKEAPKPKTKEQLQLEEAIKRADEAEKRATDAEKKLQDHPAAPAPDAPPAPVTPTPAPSPSP
ncbi:MAG: hypothetical protein ABI591_24510 [Kofleriaceae bacterium]